MLVCFNLVSLFAKYSACVFCCFTLNSEEDTLMIARSLSAACAYPRADNRSNRFCACVFAWLCALALVCVGFVRHA